MRKYQSRYKSRTFKKNYQRKPIRRSSRRLKSYSSSGEALDYDMRCTSPVRIQIKNKRGIPDTRYPDGLEVPCGKCMACRQQKRKEWSMRVLHESTEYRNECFTTLTYSDDNLPENGSLVKRDLQLFFKRLRKALPPSQKIRYFACGEYGDTYFRPHYHTILFNLGLGEADQDIINNAWGKVY